MFLLALVLDCSSLIPCGDKSKEIKEAIRQLGSEIYSFTNVVLCFSQYLIKVYHTKVATELKHHHPLPPFQASIIRVLPELRKIANKSRGFICKTHQTEKGIKFHILESSFLKSYNVENIGLTEEEDKEVLRIALASSLKYQKVFLVSADNHFLRDLNKIELLRRYKNEFSKVEIVKPDELFSKLH